MRQTLTLFLMLLSASVLFSQKNTDDWSVIWRADFRNFQFPLSDELSVDDYTTGMELTYLRPLNDRLAVALPLKVGRAHLPLTDDGLTTERSMLLGLDALAHLNLTGPEKGLQPYLLAGAGVFAETENDWSVRANLPVGLGLHVHLGRGIYLSGEAQYRYSPTERRSHISQAAGLRFRFGGEPEITDTDNDGLPDDEDQCPTEAGTADLLGCPDTDADGVADRLDDCPDTPGLTTLRGCPDTDEDGVPNHLDECPTLPGDPANKGCPNQDRDGDGVLNDQDRCPDEAGSPYAEGCPDLDQDGTPDLDDRCPTDSGLPRHNGCPDTDGDDVADPFDRCPNTPGTAANNGCPELKAEEKEVLEFAKQAVQFETGSARLKPTSYAVLDEIATILQNYPGQKLRIAGHTDSIGSAEANQQLSERRAKSCFDYLVNKGIPASRITYVGYGESQPVGDNRFSDGRQQNRRVVFEIYAE